jgi:hypothetical protein
LPRAGTSIRTVIEFDTLGTVAIDVPSLVRALISQVLRSSHLLPRNWKCCSTEWMARMFLARTECVPGGLC